MSGSVIILQENSPVLDDFLTSNEWRNSSLPPGTKRHVPCWSRSENGFFLHSPSLLGQDLACSALARFVRRTGRGVTEGDLGIRKLNVILLQSSDLENLNLYFVHGGLVSEELQLLQVLFRQSCRILGGAWLLAILLRVVSLVRVCVLIIILRYFMSLVPDMRQGRVHPDLLL